MDVLARPGDVLADDLQILSDRGSGAAAGMGKVESRRTQPRRAWMRGHEHCLSVFVTKIMLRKHEFIARQAELK